MGKELDEINECNENKKKKWVFFYTNARLAKA